MIKKTASVTAFFPDYLPFAGGLFPLPPPDGLPVLLGTLFGVVPALLIAKVIIAKSATL